MESLWDIVCSAVIGAFTDPAVLSALSSLVTVLLAIATKGIREWIVKTCKKAAKWITRRPVRIDGTTATRFFDINADLAILRNALGASRVSIYQFHNGDKFTLSDPIFKITCSHENVSHGLVPDSLHIKYVLVSTMMNFLAPLMDRKKSISGVEEFDTAGHGPLRILKYSISKMDYDGFHHIMMMQGVRTMYSVLLYANDKKSPVGTLCIQYTSTSAEESDEMIRKQVDYIRGKVCQLEFCLDEDLI